VASGELKSMAVNDHHSNSCLHNMNLSRSCQLIFTVYCHECGRILTKLDHPNVMAVQIFRSTLACIFASHMSVILQLAITAVDLSCPLFICHFIFALVLICSDMWSRCFDLAHKQWIHYATCIPFFCVYSALIMLCCFPNGLDKKLYFTLCLSHNPGVY